MWVKLLEIGFIITCLVLNSFPMTTPKAFLHALGGQVFFTLWNETISCHINKQEMSQPSAISGLQMWMRAPWMLPPPTVIAEELGECKKQGNKETGLIPDSWDSYERNEFNEPRGLHLPRHRMLNSLTWYLIFEVQTACSLCCKLVYNLTSPPASLEQFSQSYRDAVSQAQSPKNSHRIE